MGLGPMLSESGWVLQDMAFLNPGASLGLAVREYPTDICPADYVLLLDRKPVGVIEAQKEGVALSAVQEQAGRYTTSALKYSVKNGILPLVFESTGVETRFTAITSVYRLLKPNSNRSNPGRWLIMPSIRPSSSISS